MPLLIRAMNKAAPELVYALVSVYSPRIAEDTDEYRQDYAESIFREFPNSMYIKPYEKSHKDDKTTLVFVALNEINAENVCDLTYPVDSVMGFLARHPETMPYSSIDTQEKALEYYVPSTVTIH